MEASSEEVIKEFGIVLNIEQIVCVRNLPRRKKGQQKGNVGKDWKGWEPLKIMVLEKVNSLSFVKTTVGRRVST